jgi:hypothetical protein
VVRVKAGPAKRKAKPKEHRLKCFSGEWLMWQQVKLVRGKLVCMCGVRLEPVKA